MIGDFNIRDSDYYPYYLAHSNTLMEIADSLDLRISYPIYQVLTYYTDNINSSNSVIDLMFLQLNSIEVDNYLILPES